MLIFLPQVLLHIAPKQESITGYYILKQSIDARSKTIWINLTVVAFINEPFTGRPFHAIDLKHVTHASQSAIIIGSGPAGLFAALKLLELGIKPIILERGKDVRSRRRDLASLNKQGIVNSDSNYSFGEGGAGTYSDGKLYTRSNKRGDISRILNLFVQFGADEKYFMKLIRILAPINYRILLLPCGKPLLHAVAKCISIARRLTL